MKQNKKYTELFTTGICKYKQTLSEAGMYPPDTWAELIDYLGGANLAANKTGETGSTLLNQTDRATNETGFHSLPGGNRFSDSRFKFIGVNGNWWSSTESSSTHAWARSMTYNSNNLYRRSYFKRYGYSVRCIKD